MSKEIKIKTKTRIEYPDEKECLRVISKALGYPEHIVVMALEIQAASLEDDPIELMHRHYLFALDVNKMKEGGGE